MCISDVFGLSNAVGPLTAQQKLPAGLCGGHQVGPCAGLLHVLGLHLRARVTMRFRDNPWFLELPDEPQKLEQTGNGDIASAE